MTWTRDTAAPKGKPFKAIKCLTCDKIVPSRSFLKQHMNHNVVYINLDGTVDN